MNSKIKSVVRHGGAVLLFIAMLVLVGASREVNAATALVLVTFEIVALWSVYLVLSVFTPINYIDEISKFYNEGAYNHEKFYGAVAVTCTVFISVHLLYAGCVFGIYFTQFRPVP